MTHAELHFHYLTKAAAEPPCPSLPFYLDCATKGVKAPSPKELRMMSMLQRLYGSPSISTYFAIYVNILCRLCQHTFLRQNTAKVNVKVKKVIIYG